MLLFYWFPNRELFIVVFNKVFNCETKEVCLAQDWRDLEGNPVPKDEPPPLIHSQPLYWWEISNIKRRRLS